MTRREAKRRACKVAAVEMRNVMRVADWPYLDWPEGGWDKFVAAMAELVDELERRAGPLERGLPDAGEGMPESQRTRFET